ncbi:MAG: ISL3 family transposase [Desulfobacterales bacterium]|jgi:transposase
MLIRSLIKDTLSLQGFRVELIVRYSFGISVKIVADKRYKPRCGQCGCPGQYRDTRPQRHFKHVPLWGIPVELNYRPRRVFCSHCKGIYVERIPWAAGKRRLTAAFACYLATWAQRLPWIEVARLFQCSWGTVASSVQFVVKYGLENRNLLGLTHIGIDEIARRKGHKYLTNVYDLKTKKLIWSGEGRSEDTLKKFFKYIGPEKASKLQGICCDMWMPYINVIEKKAPKALLVFDKFHITRHLMEAVDQVRRSEIAQKGKEHKQLMKHTRYIWLKNPWNLTDKQKSKLGSLEKLNLKINRAYLLKEAFRNLWLYKTAGWAHRYLNQWFWWATHSRLQPIRKFAWMIRRHEDNILSYFKLLITNASVEGLNNKAKIISRRAYGFRSVKSHILNLYHGLADLTWPKLLHTFV